MGEGRKGSLAWAEANYDIRDGKLARPPVVPRGLYATSCVNHTRKEHEKEYVCVCVCVYTHIYMYNWVTLLFSRNSQNTGNQPSFSKIVKIIFKKKRKINFNSIQSFPGNRRGRNHFSRVFMKPVLPQHQNQNKTIKKENAQNNITHDYRSKNP